MIVCSLDFHELTALCPGHSDVQILHRQIIKGSLVRTLAMLVGDDGVDGGASITIISIMF